MNLFCFCFLLGLFSEAYSFQTNSLCHRRRAGIVNPTRTTPSAPLYLFGKNKEDVEAARKASNSGENNDQKRRLPFFGRVLRSNRGKQNTSEEVDVDIDGEDSNVETSNPAPVAIKVEQEDPAEKAKILLAQAERARLEAERMDAALTLQKIERLEKELLVATSKGDSVEGLQLQLDNLQAKLRGEAPKPVVAAKPTKSAATDDEEVEDSVSTMMVASNIVINSNKKATVTLDMKEILNSDDFHTMREIVDGSPGFIRKVMASMVELEFNTTNDINATELATRMTMVSNLDFSYSSLDKPTFTTSQIEKALERIEKQQGYFPQNWIEKAAGDKRKLAEYYLKSEYYMDSQIGETSQEVLLESLKDEEWMQPLLDAINTTAVDRTIESFYPKCTRKEDAEEPTMAEVQSLVVNVLPEAKFTSSSKPEKVLGGYILRGSHKYEDGDKLIAAIDNGLAKTGLADKMTVLYAPDFTVFARAEEDDFDFDLFDAENIPPILYITGPSIVRDRQPVLLSLTSAAGLATSWYLSIYPFLLNTAFSKRVEEQLAVADAGMTYDLQWLTDMSVPLFVYFLGIQFAHEIGHRVVASIYDMKISVPTLVPSLVTGTTSTVTTFKETPKNKEAIFDFAVAGPLTGILASVAALIIGSQMTLISDPSTLPGLPLEILRQSTLGGGIIDGIIQGSLYVPDGAPMSGITIMLHPLAIAGYIGLVVNALALLPVGTTDGGRMGLALFGRGAKQIIGNLFLFALLFTGVLGSDLFLFYFAFVIAFQTGNEIPARNEVDDISFARVIVATLAYGVAFLSLVPFQ